MKKNIFTINSDENITIKNKTSDFLKKRSDKIKKFLE